MRDLQATQYRKVAAGPTSNPVPDVTPSLGIGGAIPHPLKENSLLHFLHKIPQDILQDSPILVIGDLNL